MLESLDLVLGGHKLLGRFASEPEAGKIMETTEGAAGKRLMYRDSSVG
jgi:hypothetical protein